MRKSRERDLEILTAVGEGRPLTQRALAQRLGVALGLTNLYLKRLASKGLIKIIEFARTAGGHLLGFPVRALDELVDEEIDAIIVATFDRPEPYFAELKRLGFPAEKLLSLRRPLPTPASEGDDV